MGVIKEIIEEIEGKWGKRIRGSCKPSGFEEWETSGVKK